ncbi:MAG TPA: TonB-dependent receptor [Bacteroidales bacterium]|nr:TonB-dependent receptor [Bacteroidales bacterium]
MKKILFFILLFFSAVFVNGQDVNNLTIQLNNILFNDLVDTIETLTPVKIYYTNKWVDSLYLDVNSKGKSLDELLNTTLRKQGLSFIITDDNKVILSKGYSIKTSFEKEYLEYLRKNRVQADTTKFIRPSAEQENKSISDEYKVFKIGKPSAVKEGKAVLSGTITNATEGEPISGAIVYVEKLKVGAMTNNAGYYAITLPKGQYQLEYRMIGMKTTRRNVIVYSDGALDVDMVQNTNQLNEVFVSANRENNVKNARIGIEKINSKMLKQIPLGLGEVDIIKSSLALPGVQSVGEAASGYNVRGGSTDQNLVLLDNAPIINTSHFFGFFSAINSDVVSDVTLYKSGMPARFGGRLSSVMEIVPATGSREKYKVSGGISPVTGRIVVEGPISKKCSFIIGSRTTYSDWLLKKLDDKQLQKSHANFIDLDGNLSWDINEKNSLSLSGYFSRDKFDYYRETAFNYGNIASTLKWKHTFSTRLSGQFYAIMSNYNYTIDDKEDSTSYNSLRYQIDQKILRADFLFFPADRHKVEFGIDATGYSLQPGKREPLGSYSTVTSKELEKEQAIEPSLYLSDEFEVTPNLTVTAGLRGTWFMAFGPKTEYQYYANTSRSVESISDTVSYGSGDIYQSYPNIEFRLSSRLLLASNLSLKIGIQRAYQYLHMISNTTSMSPTDIWKLSDSYIKPQRGDQYSVGLYQNFPRKGIEASVEGYYKNLNNVIDFKGGAQLLMNEHLETDIISGKGKAYGIELMLKKQTGPLTGWVSYTYSRVFSKFDSKFKDETINDGSYFPANFDKPNDLKLVANLKLSRRINVSTNFDYSTGRPITFPVAFYEFNNTTRVYYSDRNAFRIPYYMRLDFSATLNGNLRVKKLNHSSFTATVYNVLGRKNPYSIFFKNEGGEIKGYQMTIFGQPIFMITYNFRILGNAKDDF